MRPQLMGKTVRQVVYYRLVGKQSTVVDIWESSNLRLEEGVTVLYKCSYGLKSV